MTHLRWRYREDPPLSGAANMASDHALAETLPPDQAVLRFYQWSAPTVSLGRNQAATGRYDLDDARALGIDFVRRPTGGGAVLHDGEVTYAVVTPIRAFGGPRAAFSVVSEGLLAGVRALGVAARLERFGEVAGAPRAERLCFGVRAPGEISVEGHKLLGSAQARIGRALIQHGSLLISDGQERLARITRGAVFPGAKPTTLERELNGPVDRALVRRALSAALQDRLGGVWEDAGATSDERDAAARLESRYRDPKWTWRR